MSDLSHRPAPPKLVSGKIGWVAQLLLLVMSCSERENSWSIAHFKCSLSSLFLLPLCPLLDLWDARRADGRDAAVVGGVLVLCYYCRCPRYTNVVVIIIGTNSESIEGQRTMINISYFLRHVQTLSLKFIQTKYQSIFSGLYLDLSCIKHHSCPEGLACVLAPKTAPHLYRNEANWRVRMPKMYSGGSHTTFAKQFMASQESLL